MEAHAPTFENPYPDDFWSEISAFRYDTPIHLYRAIEAVQRRAGDDADYVLGRDYRVRFRLDGAEREIVVPQGMVTDLASVPRIVRVFIGRVGPHLEASIVHDFLYLAWQDMEGRGARDEDRAFADALMRVAMAEAGVNRITRFLMFWAVRLGGRGVYRRRDPVRFVRIPAQATA